MCLAASIVASWHHISHILKPRRLTVANKDYRLLSLPFINWLVSYSVLRPYLKDILSIIWLIGCDTFYTLPQFWHHTPPHGTGSVCRQCPKASSNAHTSICFSALRYYDKMDKFFYSLSDLHAVSLVSSSKIFPVMKSTSLSCHVC